MSESKYGYTRLDSKERKAYKESRVTTDIVCRAEEKANEKARKAALKAKINKTIYEIIDDLVSQNKYREETIITAVKINVKKIVQERFPEYEATELTIPAIKHHIAEYLDAKAKENER